MQKGLEDQLGLYQKRIPIFTRSVKGRFRRFKTSVLALAYAIYFLLPNEAREVPMKFVLSNAFGFGGHNACLVFKRLDD